MAQKYVSVTLMLLSLVIAATATRNWTLNAAEIETAKQALLASDYCSNANLASYKFEESSTEDNLLLIFGTPNQGTQLFFGAFNVSQLNNPTVSTFRMFGVPKQHLGKSGEVSSLAKGLSIQYANQPFALQPSWRSASAFTEGLVHYATYQKVVAETVNSDLVTFWLDSPALLVVIHAVKGKDHFYYVAYSTVAKGGEAVCIASTRGLSKTIAGAEDNLWDDFKTYEFKWIQADQIYELDNIYTALAAALKPIPGGQNIDARELVMRTKISTFYTNSRYFIAECKKLSLLQIAFFFEVGDTGGIKNLQKYNTVEEAIAAR